MSRRQLGLGILLLLAGVWTDPGHAGFDELVRHLPDRANTVILFNVDEILASPLAVKEGWAAKEQQAFAANWIVVPPGTMRYAGAAQLELASMQPVWQAGVAELQFEPSMAKAAALHGGSVDEISGRSVAALPPDMYVVQFGKQLAGFLRPANRQDAGRWIDEVYSDSSRMPLSPYLVEGVGFADKLGTPIIVAVDLKHVFPAAFIRGRLDSLPSPARSECGSRSAQCRAGQRPRHNAGHYDYRPGLRQGQAGFRAGCTADRGAGQAAAVGSFGEPRGDDRGVQRVASRGQG